MLQFLEIIYKILLLQMLSFEVAWRGDAMRQAGRRASSSILHAMLAHTCAQAIVVTLANAERLSLLKGTRERALARFIAIVAG